MNTVVITWNVSDIAQAEVSGTVTFRLSQPLTDTSTGNLITPDPPRTYTFSNSPGQSDPLVANDSPSLDPQGSTYTVTLETGGEQTSYTVAINAANGATQTLGSLVDAARS